MMYLFSRRIPFDIHHHSSAHESYWASHVFSCSRRFTRPGAKPGKLPHFGPLTLVPKKNPEAGNPLSFVRSLARPPAQSLRLRAVTWPSIIWLLGKSPGASQIKHNQVQLAK